MSFEEVFKYALRVFVNLEHKAVGLDLFNRDKISLDYGTTTTIFKKQDYEKCKRLLSTTYAKELDLSSKDCLFYTQDPKGLSFTLNPNATYKVPDYARVEGYRLDFVLHKMLGNNVLKSEYFRTSLPNLYSPVNGVVEKLIMENGGSRNYFVSLLIIKDTLGYKHIFRYFYANVYPNAGDAKVSPHKDLPKDTRFPIAEGDEIQIGDFLGFLAYENGIASDAIHMELGFNDYLFFKYILQDSNGDFLNPITFWQWNLWEHYAVYNAQSKEKESEIIYYFDSNHQMVEIAYKKEGEEHFERFFPNLHLHRFFRDSAYIHHYHHLSQAIYPYKLLFNGELEKIVNTDYPLLIDKPYGIISLNTQPSEGEILLDCCFTLRNEALKETIVYFYNTEDKKIYQMPSTNTKGEVQCSIKKEQIHSNTLLYFALHPNAFFDTYFGACRSHQITPKEKEQNKTTIHLNLKEPNQEQKHYLELQDSTTNTAAKEWQRDREQKLDSQRVVSVINRGDKELFQLKDIENLNLIEPDKILALKLSHINTIQWFSKKAVNYYELIKTSDLDNKKECEKTFKIHYDTWKEFGEFIESLRPTQENTKNAASFALYATRYRSRGEGDWKEEKAKGFFLTSMEGTPFWTDALGQLPFAINIYRGFCDLLKNLNATLDYEQQIKPMARNATINVGYVFSEGEVKELSNLYKKGFINFANLNSNLYKQEQHPPLDFLSYDNTMILRGINWVDWCDENNTKDYSKLSEELEENKMLLTPNPPPNVIRIEAQDGSEEYIEIILPEEESNTNDREQENDWLDLTLDIGLAAVSKGRIKPKNIINKVNKALKLKSKYATRQEVLDVLEKKYKLKRENPNIKSGKGTAFMAKDNKQIKEIWEDITEGAEVLDDKGPDSYGDMIKRRKLSDNTILQLRKKSSSKGSAIEINKKDEKQIKIHNKAKEDGDW